MNCAKCHRPLEDVAGVCLITYYLIDRKYICKECAKKMKIKRLKELIKNVSDDVDVYFMFGLNDKYEDKENGVFTLKENGESSYLENKLIFTLREE